jgi:prepilin-type N-terminal cleavage/methylation domain-containing protein
MIRPTGSASRSDQRPSTAAFTLVELLVSISIVAILASTVMFAMAGVQETARQDRTRAQIARIHTLIAEKWEGYRTRRVPMVLPSYRSFRAAEMRSAERYRTLRITQNLAKTRIDAVRELMRMELPDRKTDLLAPPQVLAQEPLLWRAYRKQAARMVAPRDWTDNVRGWTPDNETAECLYLILSQIRDGDTTALEFLSPREIGDVDKDGMLEILDGWGEPIRFLRWAPGFAAVGGYQEPLAPDHKPTADPFDPRGVYAQSGSFALYPLIFSAGADKLHEIRTSLDVPSGGGFGYASLTPPNNPFVAVDGRRIGEWYDSNQDNRDNSQDNLHNHLLAGA